MSATVSGSGSRWDYIVSSPLQRCVAFATDYGRQMGIPVSLDPRWQELGFGSWEGRTKDEIEAESPGAVQALLMDPERNQPAGAEPLHLFSGRVWSAFHQLARDNAGRRGLIVSHACVIRLIVNQVLEAPLARLFQASVPPASLTRILVKDSNISRGELICHGWTPTLEL